MKASAIIAASAVVNVAPAETPISTGAFLLLTVLFYSKRAVVFKPLFTGYIIGSIVISIVPSSCILIVTRKRPVLNCMCIVLGPSRDGRRATHLTKNHFRVQIHVEGWRQARGPVGEASSDLRKSSEAHGLKIKILPPTGGFLVSGYRHSQFWFEVIPEGRTEWKCSGRS